MLQAGENSGDRRLKRGIKYNYQKPELLAVSPNEVWSWDITKLKGPQKWSYFYLYVILDIFSRYVVGWLVADKESAELAKNLIGQTCEKQNIQESQLTLHARFKNQQPTAGSLPTEAWINQPKTESIKEVAFFRTP